MCDNGSIVSINGSSQYGVVKESFAHGGRTLYHVHYIDPMNGRLVKCPDPRCHGEHTCPIHGSNLTEDQIEPFTQADIDLLVQEGMIDRRLLRK